MRREITEDAIVRILQSFAKAVIDPKEWLPALLIMSDAMGAASCAMELADLNTGLASINCTYPLDTHVVRLYEERIYHINPRVHRARKVPVGMIVDDRHLLVPDDPNMGEFIDWLDHTPNQFVEGAKLLQENGQEIYFGSYFSKAHGPPDASHGKIHRLVVPNLINFISIGRVFSQNKLNNELVTQQELDSGKPFALLNGAGGIIECSVGFESVLKSGSLLAIRNGRLVAARVEQRRLIDHFLRSAVGERRYLEPPMPIRLTGPSNPKGLVLRAVPLPPRDDVFDTFRPSAMITITDLDQPMRVRRRELMALFDLTQREADVAALIGEGFTNERAAHELAISLYTVKQHLKVVFSKMGVDRQSDLVALITRLR